MCECGGGGEGQSEQRGGWIEQGKRAHGWRSLSSENTNVRELQQTADTTTRKVHVRACVCVSIRTTVRHILYYIY